MNHLFLSFLNSFILKFLKSLIRTPAIFVTNGELFSLDESNIRKVAKRVNFFQKTFC
ncbi:hypothetical protein JCM6292_1568 [Bacteroides pyogenes JCM 6292]|uniref:Uncharacterized protein n=2 Tax=Bacteroides pyogenes TaxID=310300 RepID=W4PL64_9BACE|nr:hypothetical protein JCM6292_1568 [Bacteroides pyogenes JCM 6292]GAE20188.1 hypothetical protein JCM6294_3347 [Bacteroides pyogenes DSM 20611 = JCM 6294]